MQYPRPIESIHQIEISSRCNLRCVYCPSKDLDKPVADGGSGRAKEDISMENFERALEWAQHFHHCGTQGELALTGLGEALLHPDFVDFVRLARKALPSNRITFSTNGLLLTEKLVEELAPYRPEIYISLHRPEKAKGAIDAAQKAGLLAATNASFATLAFDWAGQLDWEVSIPEDSVTCEFLRSGWAVVLADGRLTTCCLDATGAGVVGHVADVIGSLSIQPWGTEGGDGRNIGCESCHMVVP
jgi:organic radical activating enzyme